MLTVKHSSYCETVYEALSEVRYYEREDPRSCSAGAKAEGEYPYVSFATHGNPLKTIKGEGRVFVMNEHGATVAKYDLDGYPAVERGKPVR